MINDDSRILFSSLQL